MFSSIKKVLQFAVEYGWDLWTFLRFNGYSPLVSKNKRLFFKTVIEVHTVEKGLALPDRKHLFGREKIRFVMRSLTEYDPRYSSLPVEMAVGALDAYLNFHRDEKIFDPFLSEVEAFVAQWKLSRDVHSGGIKSFDIEAIRDCTEPAALIATRSSLRMFDGVPVSVDVVKELVRLAQFAPSQCNRQASRVHVYQERDLIDQLLALQGGSRGFSSAVGNLFVVTSEVAAWGGAGQRNQPYVDGALFSMNLLLACHANELGACPLNLAITNSVERKIRKVGAIPSGERLIMMIAFGKARSGPLRVASSPRRGLEEILCLHSNGAAA